MTRKIFSSVGFAAALLALSSLLSKVLGVLRDIIFAKIFGLGTSGTFFALDAYFAAFKVPDFIYNVLVFGSISVAFVPIYLRLKHEKNSNKEADAFASQLIVFIFLIVLGFSLLAFFFAPELMRLLAPGFSETDFSLTVSLMRILLLSPIFLALSSIFQGLENAYHRFWGIALAPLVYNLSIILSALFFAEQWGVYALAWGTVFGTCLHALVQIPDLLKTPFLWRKFSFRLGADFLDFLRLSGPRIFGLLGNQFGIFVDTAIATVLVAGSLSAYQYALNLQSLPYAVVAVSFSVAVFSTLVEKSLEEDKSKLMTVIQDSSQLILFWILPCVFGLFLLREDLVSVLLKGGAFGDDAVSLTAKTLGFFVWAALGQSFIPLFARIFYALKTSYSPMWIALVSVLIQISTSLILTQVYHFGVEALAISAFFAATINFLLLLIFLAMRLKKSPLDFFKFRATTWTVFNSMIMFSILFLVQKQFPLPSLVELFVLPSLGFAIYFSLSKLNRTIPVLRGF